MDELTLPRRRSCALGWHRACPSPTTSTTSTQLRASARCRPTSLTASRWNAAFAFLDPVRAAPHLRIAGNTTVRRLLISRGAVTGVEVVAADGSEQTIRAGRVVLAAGAYHSPALLLRSGVGPASELPHWASPLPRICPAWVGISLIIPASPSTSPALRR